MSKLSDFIGGGVDPALIYNPVIVFITSSRNWVAPEDGLVLLTGTGGGQGGGLYNAAVSRGPIDGGNTIITSGNFSLELGLSIPSLDSWPDKKYKSIPSWMKINGTYHDGSWETSRNLGPMIGGRYGGGGGGYSGHVQGGGRDPGFTGSGGVWGGNGNGYRQGAGSPGIYRTRLNVTKNQSINVTIGAGGEGNSHGSTSSGAGGAGAVLIEFYAGVKFDG